MATKWQYITERFDGLNAMCDAMSKRQTQKGARFSSHEHGEDFTGTKSYEEANHIARTGDKEHAKAIQDNARAMRQKGGQWEQRNVANVRRCVVGSRPCVPAAIMGHPVAMYRREVNRVDKPVLNVFYSYAPSGCTSKKEIVDVGTRVTEAIRAIERSGVRVNLFAGMILEKDYAWQRIAVFTKIKDSSKDMDVLRMAYPLIHPSYFRRHMFRWIETRPELIQSEWSHGYGQCITDREREAQFVEELNRQGWNIGAFLTFYSERNASIEEIVEHITKQNQAKKKRRA